MTDTIPRLKYNETENAVWKLCYERLMTLHKTTACKEFNWTIEQFQKEIGLTGDEIP